MIDENKLIECLAYDISCYDELKGKDLSKTYVSVADMVRMICGQPKIGGWIPCSERMPENEEDVEITYVQEAWPTGEKRFLTARAFHEDGTLAMVDSAYDWDEAYHCEYDEEADLCTVLEGWWESISFSERFGQVDMPVIAWRPLPQPYTVDYQD
ncbi:MAG: DUF551 domain-containing protein [Lachnospiraceae bacterium]|nr:DUF551 domain-containing protein [Lachnospiraceae bacterium]MCM1240460.1 DUF551 domain-containing protein [Lachnospiraceae bacterium]